MHHKKTLTISHIIRKEARHMKNDGPRNSVGNKIPIRTQAPNEKKPERKTILLQYCYRKTNTCTCTHKTSYSFRVSKSLYDDIVFQPTL